MNFGTALGRIAKSMYATGAYIEWIPLWFLPSLFITSLLAYFFYRYLFFRVANRYVRWLILLMTLLIGIFCVDAFYPFSISILGKEYELYGLPYSLDIVLVSGFFYMLGSETRQIRLDKIIKDKRFLFPIGGALILLNAIFIQRMDLGVRVFDSFMINTTEAILGILFTLALSKQIDMKNTWLAKVLKYIGQASLFILIFHVSIQEYWGAKIYFVTELRALSILAAFVISTVISLGIYRIFIEQNHLALYVFGRRAALSEKTENQVKTESRD